MNMKDNLIPILLVLLAVSILGVYLASEDNKTFTIRNNSTRDYKFEHYCDSIYEVDPDYYLDVLVESDTFQNYVDKHGEW